MKGWQRSNLKIGEEVRLPMTIFIEPEKSISRFIGTTYAGETDAGLLIDCEFMPLFGKTENLHYKRFIDWASIWCGDIKMYDANNEMIRAYRIAENQ